MSDQPLFYGRNIQKVVHPAKILPSLLERQQQKRKQTSQNQSNKIYADIFDHVDTGKEKKIKK